MASEDVSQALEQSIMASIPEARDGPEDSKSIVLIGGKINDNLCNMTCYSLRKQENTWCEFASFPTNKPCYMQVCVWGKDILVTGGKQSDGLNNTGECWLYRVADKRWTSMPSLQTPRSCHLMVCLGDNMYVCGGQADNILDSCEMMNPKKHGWVYMPSLLTATSAPAGVIFEGSIYAIGGDTAPSYNQCFDIRRRVWLRKCDPPVQCEWGPSAVVIKDRIFVVGGKSNACLSYNPRQDSWTILSQQNMPHLGGAAIAWKGRVILGGGIKVKMGHDVVELFDPDFNDWYTMSVQLPKKLSGHCLLSVPYFE